MKGKVLVFSAMLFLFISQSYALTTSIKGDWRYTVSFADFDMRAGFISNIFSAENIVRLDIKKTKKSGTLMFYAQI
jgi:hypothetical protein